MNIKALFLLLAVAFSAQSFANTAVVDRVAAKLQAQRKVEVIEIRGFEGPRPVLKEKIYKVIINRSYSIGFSSTYKDTFKIILIADTRSVGPATVAKMEKFEELFWDIFNVEIPASVQGSTSGGAGFSQVTIRATPQLQEKYLLKIVSRLVSEI